MKKISLSVLAILFAGVSIFAVVPPQKKAVKHATCTYCPKGEKCTKANCPDPDDCCK